MENDIDEMDRFVMEFGFCVGWKRFELLQNNVVSKNVGLQK